MNVEIPNLIASSYPNDAALPLPVAARGLPREWCKCR